MMFDLNPRVKDWRGRRVWIVGASSGIGAATAQRLLKEGARVVLSARRPDQLASVAAGHANAIVYPMDVMDEDIWPRAIDEVSAMLGGLDLVMFLAGRYDAQHSWEIDADAVQKSFDLNVVSLYRALATLVPALLKQGSGGIAITGSISGYTGLPKALVYGATKAALINLAESLYFELAPKGLSIYLINPGFVETPMTAANDFKMPGLMKPPAAADAIVEGISRGRFEIRFPRSFAGGLRVLSRMPYLLRFSILHRTTGL